MRTLNTEQMKVNVYFITLKYLKCTLLLDITFPGKYLIQDGFPLIALAIGERSPWILHSPDIYYSRQFNLFIYVLIKLEETKILALFHLLISLSPMFSKNS